MFLTIYFVIVLKLTLYHLYEFNNNSTNNINPLVHCAVKDGNSVSMELLSYLRPFTVTVGGVVFSLCHKHYNGLMPSSAGGLTPRAVTEKPCNIRSGCRLWQCWHPYQSLHTRTVAITITGHPTETCLSLRQRCRIENQITLFCMTVTCTFALNSYSKL